MSLPTTLQSIGNGAFQGCTGITTYDINFSTMSALEYINSAAFEGCAWLSDEISFPASLQIIGNRAFLGTGITSLTFPASSVLDYIGKEAFRNCTDLAGTILFPASL